MILTLAADHEALITIEEGAVGGFGSHVAQLLADEGVFDDGLKYRSMVLPDTLSIRPALQTCMRCRHERRTYRGQGAGRSGYCQHCGAAGLTHRPAQF